MRERLAERKSWKTRAGEQKQSLAAAVRYLQYAGQDALPSQTLIYSLGWARKSRRQRHGLQGTAPSHHFPKPQLVYKQRIMPSTGQVMLVGILAKPCSHISRLSENIWLAGTRH